MRVADVMQREVRCLSPRMRVADLDDWLLEKRVSGAPVVEGDRVVGIVSRSDVVRQLVVETTLAQSAADALHGGGEADPGQIEARVADAVARRWRTLRVEDVMIRDVVAVAPDASLEEAARTMLAKRIHRLLVLDGGRLVGLVSSLDLVRIFAPGSPPA